MIAVDIVDYIETPAAWKPSRLSGLSTSARSAKRRIMWSQRDPSLRRSGVGNVFIKNFGESLGDEKLKKVFSKFDKTISYKVVKDRMLSGARQVRRVNQRTWWPGDLVATSTKLDIKVSVSENINDKYFARVKAEKSEKEMTSSRPRGRHTSRRSWGRTWHLQPPTLPYRVRWPTTSPVTSVRIAKAISMSQFNLSWLSKLICGAICQRMPSPWVNSICLNISTAIPHYNEAGIGSIWSGWN